MRGGKGEGSPQIHLKGNISRAWSLVGSVGCWRKESLAQMPGGQRGLCQAGTGAGAVLSQVRPSTLGMVKGKEGTHLGRTP